MKTVKDFNVRQKRVLLRCDFNVPLSKEGDISDDFRISQTLPTIEYLLSNSAKVILMSHLGDPKGKAIEKFKLDKIQEKLIEFLDISVTKAPDCVGRGIQKWTESMRGGEVLLLENLRFHKEEEDNDGVFAKQLASLGDIYFNDAFGVCHRAHASVAGVPEYLPAGAGFLLEKEIKVLDNLIKKPERPLIAIIGGVKVETKSRLIDKISQTADFVLVGGLIQKEIKEKNITFKYPEKIVAPVGSGDSRDINEETVELFREKILKAKTVFWNGPLGKFEEEKFSKGTLAVARASIASGAVSVVGGGETIDFINQANMTDKFNHVSTGGGAMLAYMSGDELPGLQALRGRGGR